MRCDRAAIILAGGRSQRMGRDKLALKVESATLLQRCVTAALSWADRVVVVGPAHPDLSAARAGSSITFVREDPPFSGPAAGIGAGVSSLSGESSQCQVLLLAGDLAHPEEVLRVLGTADLPERDSPGQPGRTDALVLQEDGGWPQLLAGVYLLGPLRAAVKRAGDLSGRSVRSLMAPLAIQTRVVSNSITRDVDTPGDFQGAFGSELRPE